MASACRSFDGLGDEKGKGVPSGGGSYPFSERFLDERARDREIF
jgi:hypothetical protein